MSSVRMCDRCLVIFSENDDDWSSTQGSVQRKRENGTRYAEQVNIDLCASCTSGGRTTGGPRLPAPELTAGATAAAPDAAAQAADQAEREDDHVMLRDLQRQVDELRDQRTAPTVPGTVVDEPVRM
jgi:hypothetical protein